jgi:hypothetical protein
MTGWAAAIFFLSCQSGFVSLLAQSSLCVLPANEYPSSAREIKYQLRVKFFEMKQLGIYQDLKSGKHNRIS